LTLEQAAEILGTPVRFVQRLVAERRITYVRLGKVKHVRIHRSDLDAFIAAGRVQAHTRTTRSGRAA
jgi:excisionase family DNA binding protein